MLEELVHLFRPDDPPPYDPQAYREALLDLMVWTMFVDRHLALAERDLLDTLTSVMEWTSRVPLPDYLRESTARARAAVDEGDATAADYLTAIRNRIEHADDRRKVLTACRNLVNSDGKLRPAEIDHLKKITKAFEL